jgi:hypothetical protein
MSQLRRFAAGSAAALALAALPATSAAAAATAHGARPSLPVRVMHVTTGGHTATVTIRGGWKLAHATLPREHLPRPVIIRPGTAHAVGAASSGNWSGYADVANSGAALRYVTANFNIPSLNCANSSGGSGGIYYASWAGLDGYDNGTVEQEGIESYCQSGTPGLWVFYEMYPADPVVFTGANPGDALATSTYYNSTTKKYSLVVDDLTQSGAGISVSESCAGTCSNSTAEVISEAPGGGPPTYGLADFGAESYTNAAVTSRNGTKGTLSAAALWKSYAINMVNQSSHDTLATAGPLQGGTAFLDTWKAST